MEWFGFLILAQVWEEVTLWCQLFMVVWKCHQCWKFCFQGYHTHSWQAGAGRGEKTSAQGPLIVLTAWSLDHSWARDPREQVEACNAFVAHHWKSPSDCCLLYILLNTEPWMSVGEEHTGCDSQVKGQCDQLRAGQPMHCNHLFWDTSPQTPQTELLGTPSTWLLMSSLYTLIIGWDFL